MLSAYPRILDSVLLPGYDRLRGRRYTERRRFLDQSQWWDAERLRTFQWTELRALLVHAFAAPYLERKYREAGISGPDDIRNWDDFRRLPPLSREEINAHRSELCSTAYKGTLLPHATGGSSGTPTRFFRTYESYDWRTAAKDRVYEWSGWRLGEPSIYLWGAPVGHVSSRQRMKQRSFERVHRQLIVNTFSQTDELWRGVHAAIVRTRPTLVVGYVSSLDRFAEFVLRSKLELPPVRAVIGAAEPLFDVTRATIEAATHAPVFNTYGSREFMSVAGECEHHVGLHVNSENLFVETEQPGAESSEILVTDLHNHGMPFVRYRTGDAGRLLDAHCPCGRGLPMLGVIEGRVLDVLRTADGRTVPGEFFPHLLKDVPEIVRFQVEQKTPAHIVISAVLSARLSDKSALLLHGEVAKVFGTATRCELRQVDEIRALPSGKRRVTVGLG
jgi:phenylacetate-coenzyme A ligase PaaK-like adenylate-forming protein